MNHKIIIASLCIFFQISVNAQITRELKEEAKSFSLEIVKSYFDGNCAFFNDAISESIISLENQEIISKDEIKDRICDIHSRAVRDKEKTFKDYLATYQIHIFDYKEFENFIKVELENDLPSNKYISENDLFFIGYQLKSKELENFIWDDMFVFLLRKENNKWVLSGF